ncbi:MAG TPA: hypothetical protein VF184_03965 [Phycisphaeraceae bacterium]
MSLRNWVESRLSQRWSQWAREHPNLAAAIDRAKLVELAVEQLRADAQFREAMRLADLDEAKLAAAAGLLEQAQRVVERVLKF